MKTLKKIIISALVLAAVLPLFAGGSKEKKVIIWHSAQGSNAEVFQKLVDYFNQREGKEKGIFVEAIYQGKANDVLTSVNAAAGTNNLPDIAMMDATAALDMNHSEYLVTVDQLGLDTSDIMECALNAYRSERGLLALPFNLSALAYYYNLDMLHSAGWDEAPKTMDELIEFAKAVGTPERAAFAGVPTTFELTTFIGAQNGLSYMVNNRNGHDGAPTEVLFGKEGTYKAFLEKWKELYDTGYYNPITTGVVDEFIAERCAGFFASSSNMVSVLNAVGTKFPLGIAVVPILNENATGGTAASGGALFTFTDSEEVKTVLRYLISPNTQIRWSEGTGYVPVNIKTYDMTEYKSIMWRQTSFRTISDALMNSNPNLVNVWLPSAYSIYYAFQANIADVLNGKDIDTAVEEMVATVEAALASYSAQNN
ncbi:MAG: extracellular solute-binding protein [Spirochaetales bacterium]|nr:extracellular solute-binding protein [Spirochaetales bacterium]